MTENRYTWDDPLIPGHLVAEIHRLAAENAKLRETFAALSYAAISGELPEEKLVPDAVLEAVRSGVATTERLRIRRELLALIGAGTEIHLEDIDRVCPEDLEILALLDPEG